MVVYVALRFPRSNPTYQECVRQAAHKAAKHELLVRSVTMTNPDLLVSLESLNRNDWGFCMKL